MVLGKIYRFFAEIRRTLGAARAHGAPGEKPNLPATSTHKNTRQQADDLLAGTFLMH